MLLGGLMFFTFCKEHRRISRADERFSGSLVRRLLWTEPLPAFFVLRSFIDMQIGSEIFLENGRMSLTGDVDCCDHPVVLDE